MDAVLNAQPLPSPDVIMRTLNPGETANFQAQACSLVWFMRDYANENYRHNLTDSFALLSRDATLEENTEAVADRMETWNSPEEIARHYGDYFAGYGTFSGCMLEGKTEYSNGRIQEARYAFMLAMSKRPKHYAPYYNLGLLAFEEGESGEADYYYQKAMNFGAATVVYAMALNAAADGRTYWALMLLQQAADLDPERFGEKARIMENRLRSTD
jgi:tetratricopeptide (TPR) repeat protein